MKSKKGHACRQTGFTLIELLVVIAIIGILAAVILASLNDARAKARDARRLGDMKAIQTALEMYYADNGQYPQTTWTSSYQGTWQTGVLGVALAPYLSKLPIDPTNSSPIAPNGGINYSYYALSYSGTTTTQQWYMLVGRPEKNTYPLQSVRACDGTTFGYGGTIMVGGNCTQ